MTESSARFLTAIVPPRLNERTPGAVEALLQALALDGRHRFSLEVAGEPGRVGFLVRAENQEMHAHLLAQIRLAYPQAGLVPVPPEDDPLRPSARGFTATAELRLYAPAHLPLKDYEDRAWQVAGTDPLLGLLGALGGCGTNERAICQVVLQPAPADWSRGLQRLALEDPLQVERQQQAASRPPTPTSAGPGGLAILLLLGAVAGWFQVQRWLAAGDVRPLIEGAACLPLLLVVVALVVRLRAGRRHVYDRRLVGEKVGRAGYHAHLRLVVVGPTEDAAQSRLRSLAAAYQQFSQPHGNGLESAPWQGNRHQLAPGRRPPWRPLPLLTVREIATLWHLPRGEDDIPFLERTVSRRWLPPTLTDTTTDGCPVGVAEHQLRQQPVTISPFALARNMFLLAKTGRGKSTLMQRLAVWQAARGDTCVAVVDPHGDLARDILGALTDAGAREPVYVDFADRLRPVGLNLLDAHLGRDRDKTVANIVEIFSSVWDMAWGPRMEDVLRYALLTLFEVNTHLPPERQYGITHVKDLLLLPDFRRHLLSQIEDRDVRHWWSEDYERLGSGLFAQQVVKPVLTKLNRFVGSAHARTIVGQPKTTLDLRTLLRERRLLLVNTATSEVGEATAGLLAATVVDLLLLTIQEQGTLPPEQRVPARLYLDEFQTIPALHFGRLLGQLRKFGASCTLATQALATLETVDRALCDTIFANVDTLAVFQVSAQDARYVKFELDQRVDEVDLVNLEDHHCYLKSTHAGRRLPVQLVRTLPPLPGDPGEAQALAWRSAARYGRPAAEVEQTRRVVGTQHHAWPLADRPRNRTKKTDATQEALPGTDEDGAEGEPIDARSAREMEQ